ncbi:MAG: hypothetical protein ABIK43_06225, partial [candidate division WOR-3 bacterium]
LVCSTDVAAATAPNNSHKLACPHHEMVMERDTVTLVFTSSQGVNLALWQDYHWHQPVLLYPGDNPAIDFGEDGDRHLVWRMLDTATQRLCPYYRNLEYRMLPVQISDEGWTGELDVRADDSGVAHVVWSVDMGNGTSRIAYRRCRVSGTIGERFWVSTETAGLCRFPSIERYADGISVVWQQFCPGRQRPYSIVRRIQAGGVWQDPIVIMQDSLPLEHPMQDKGSSYEQMSAGWDRMVAGNREVFFYQGNGGGYPTAGVSTAPVLTTIGSVWSYLFWQDEQSGTEDICCHLWYEFGSGWYESRTLRQILGIHEDVRAPSCLGALLVWTQGDSAPYRIMWHNFDYPIGTQEPRLTSGTAPLLPGSTLVRGLLRLSPALGAGQCLLLSPDGRRVRELLPGENDLRHLAPGVYFVTVTGAGTGCRRTIGKLTVP